MASFLIHIRAAVIFLLTKSPNKEEKVNCKNGSGGRRKITERRQKSSRPIVLVIRVRFPFLMIPQTNYGNLAYLFTHIVVKHLCLLGVQVDTELVEITVEFGLDFCEGVGRALIGSWLIGPVGVHN